MDEAILEKLLTKLIGLTQFGELRWHFAGDVSKAYVTVYKDARLKLTELALDITQADSDTVRIDPRLHDDRLPLLIGELYKAAKESASRFRTGQVEVLTPASLVTACQRLLADDEPVEMSVCLACTREFDTAKSVGHLSQGADKNEYCICAPCVESMGAEAAQIRLEEAIGITEMIANASQDDAITGDTLSDLQGQAKRARELEEPERN